MDKLDIQKLIDERDQLTKKINEYLLEETKQDILKNKVYVGKCLKRVIGDKVYYYKIIQIDESNKYRMYTLYFTNFNNCYSKLVTQELCGIDSIGWFCNSMPPELKLCKEIELYDEISKDEFDTAFLKWIQNIKNI